MATPAQLAANQANAQRSTGPRSVEGKSASRFNALKHGIDAASTVIPGEDPAAYQALADAYDAQYQPANPTTRFLLDSMIRADWHKQRLQTLESGLIHKLLAETPGASLIDVMLNDSPAGKLLARIQRQIAAHERAWFRAHREIVRLAAQPLDTPDDEALPERFEIAERTQSPAPKSAKSWPPIDEKTGKPCYFVG
ncbi:MAG: hypothetical protein ABI806_29780 [Candidatus Solibacter sp.]